MRKKCFYSLMLGLMVLASCNKECPVPAYKTADGEIYFGSKWLTVKQTKAVTETDVAKLQTNGFNAAVFIDNAAKDLMFNDKVTYDSDIWKVSGKTYYYPAANTISAYAVYPASWPITMATGTASVVYTQNADEDLVVAKAMGVAKQSGAIDLTFEHALAQVNVKCQGTDSNTDYVLKTIELSAPNGGTYQFGDGQWVSLGTATAYTYYTNAGTSVPTASMQPFGESMTFIPGQVDIRVVWDCKNKVDHTVVGTYDQTVQTTLAAGEHTTLNLRLPNSDAEEIKLTIVVSNWVDNAQTIEIGGGEAPEIAAYPADNEIWYKASAPAELYTLVEGDWNEEEGDYDYIRHPIKPGDDLGCFGDLSDNTFVSQVYKNGYYVITTGEDITNSPLFYGFGEFGITEIVLPNSIHVIAGNTASFGLHFQKVVLGNAVTTINADAIGSIGDERHVRYLEIHTIIPPAIVDGEVAVEMMFGFHYKDEVYYNPIKNYPTAIKVPETAVEEYKWATCWDAYSDYISAID